MDLKSLHLQAGFPCQRIVEPKGRYEEYLEVRAPQSLIHYNFTSIEYNIGFSIERVGSFKLSAKACEEQGNEEVLRYALHDSHLKPIYVRNRY